MNKQDFRAIFVEKDSNSKLHLNIIDDTLNGRDLGVLGFDVPNVFIKSIAVNCNFQPDVSTAVVSGSDLHTALQAGVYRPKKKKYVKASGEELDCVFTFISNIIDSPTGSEYQVNIFQKGKVTPIFTVPTNKPSLEDIHVINFEIERYLYDEDIYYMDEAELKWLYEIAIDYMEEEHLNIPKKIS